MTRAVPFTERDLQDREKAWNEFIKSAESLGADAVGMREDFNRAMWNAGYSSAHAFHCFREHRIDLIIGGIMVSIMAVILIGFITLVAAGIYALLW